ncbi:MAG: TIGR00289 family protein [Candidatus Altiarchaeales archaeon]|nr:MAG: TIGR00289 family protein [Candidatus Altiarchaeales archaeon]
MRLAALTSGGKDSLYAVYLARKGGHDIRYLLSMTPESHESYMFHHPNIELTEIQAELMGIPLLVEKTSGEKEEELKDLERLILRVKDEVDGILTGVIASNYQRERIDGICEKFSLECISPLWHINPEKYWHELMRSGFRIMITSVSAEGLDKGWLGRIIDEKAIDELKELNRRFKIHLSFEGGEAETLVLDCPMFRKGIKIVEAKREWDGQRGTYVIKRWVY